MKLRLDKAMVIAGWSLFFIVSLWIGIWFDFGLGFNWVSFWVGLAILVFSLTIKPRYIVIALVVFGGLLSGFSRAEIDTSAKKKYAEYYQNEVYVYGVVAEDPDRDSKNRMILRLKNIVINQQRLPGMIYVQLKNDAKISRSDSVILSGKLQQGFGSFSGVMYRAEVSEIQNGYYRDPVLIARNWLSDGFRQVVSEPAASLGLGYLLGMRRELPEDLAENLRIAGLTHIIVASGYNLTILVRFSRRFLAGYSKYLAAFSSLMMVILFIGVTGLSPSMSRAGLVAGLSLIAWYYGRKFHPLNLLLFVAATTLMINPNYASGDLGWMLSFAAFTGVMFLAPVMQAFFFGDKKPGALRQIAGETIAAQVMTLPLLMLYFGSFSLVAIFANLIILPFVPLAMLFVLLTSVFVRMVPILGDFVGFLTQIILDSMLSVATFWAKLEWSEMEVQVNFGEVILMYFVAIGLILFMAKKSRFKFRNVNLVD